MCDVRAILVQCAPDIVATVIVAILIQWPLFLVKIHLFYYI